MSAITRNSSLPLSGKITYTNSRRAVAALLIAAVVGACSSSQDATSPNSSSGVNGSFTASVSGAMTASLSGAAVFGTGNVNGTQGFAISLVPSGGTNSIFLARINAQAPGTGTYQISDFLTAGPVAGSLVAALFTSSSAAGTIYVSTSGTLTITSATSSEIKGTFTISASAVTISGTQAISITGTFDAVTGQLTVPVFSRR